MFSDASAEYFNPLYQKVNYAGTLSFGSCFCACNVLTLAIMRLLEFTAGKVTFGNYGLAIIALALLTRCTRLLCVI